MFQYIVYFDQPVTVCSLHVLAFLFNVSFLLFSLEYVGTCKMKHCIQIRKELNILHLATSQFILMLQSFSVIVKLAVTFSTLDLRRHNILFSVIQISAWLLNVLMTPFLALIEMDSFRILLYTLIFLLSVFGNLLIIIVLVMNKRMRTVTNSFLLSLAVSDLMMAIFCMPFTLIPNILEDFIFGAAMCKIISYFMGKENWISLHFPNVFWAFVPMKFEHYLLSRVWCH